MHAVTDRYEYPSGVVYYLSATTTSYVHAVEVTRWEGDTYQLRTHNPTTEESNSWYSDYEPYHDEIDLDPRCIHIDTPDEKYQPTVTAIRSTPHAGDITETVELEIEVKGTDYDNLIFRHRDN